MPPAAPRTICYVTGTRAEFGLMVPVLRAIRDDPRLRLQLVVTGMHLDPAHGRTVKQIRDDGWHVDALAPWPPFAAEPHLDATPHPTRLTHLANTTGHAIARLGGHFAELQPDVVLVTGDRVEAFAAATAAHLGGHVLAHVHGGDRALGQIDDALRHAITKLAHLHFPATPQSADRVRKLGEDTWRVHRVGSPGIEGITADAWPLDRCAAALKESTALNLATDPAALANEPFVVCLYHPTEPDEAREAANLGTLFAAMDSALPAAVRRVIVYPNNDPGAGGIVRYLDDIQNRIHRATPDQLSRHVFVRSAPRSLFLGLLRGAACLVGNSSAGIIEAASFGTPVVDVGPRQAGRERGENVTTVPLRRAAVTAALKRIWNRGRPIRYARRNPYGSGKTAARIVEILATTPLDDRLRRKLIAY